MWDAENPPEVRERAAVSCLPYCHPRLQHFAVESDDQRKLLIQFIDFSKKPLSNGDLVEAAGFTGCAESTSRLSDSSPDMSMAESGDDDLCTI
jgi:hypothetical protein